jgi:hypothetical protein
MTNVFKTRKTCLTLPLLLFYFCAPFSGWQHIWQFGSGFVWINFYGLFRALDKNRNRPLDIHAEEWSNQI